MHKIDVRVGVTQVDLYLEVNSQKTSIKEEKSTATLVNHYEVPCLWLQAELMFSEEADHEGQALNCLSATCNGTLSGPLISEAQTQSYLVQPLDHLCQNTIIKIKETERER